MPTPEYLLIGTPKCSQTDKIILAVIKVFGGWIPGSETLFLFKTNKKNRCDECLNDGRNTYCQILALKYKAGKNKMV